MLRRRLTTAALSASLLVGVVTLAACTGEDDGVATLDRGGEATTGAGGGASPAVDTRTQAELIADQARSANDLVTCLVAADIPAVTEPYSDDGQLHVWLAIEEDHIASFGGGAAIMDGIPDWMLDLAAKYDPSMELIKEAQAGGSPTAWPTGEVPPYLIIGQQDRTEDLRRCLDSSGYTEPVNYPTPDREVAIKQVDLEATLPWIECARANGYPDLEDPVPVKADEWQTEPTAVLPADITEQEFRALLAVCPVFDEAAWLAHDQAVAELGDNPTDEQLLEIDAQYPLGYPSIGFDVPGVDGRLHSGPETNTPVPDNVVRAFEIMREERDRYFDAHPDLYPGS
ncbi:MAG: hypothetical protein LBC97_09175 [Bifidobacteriaceae bacterium]|jgi:hypothetical protein|nr:hypothetical protein [Bifidobacteriaceae bacterium]